MTDFPHDRETCVRFLRTQLTIITGQVDMLARSDREVAKAAMVMDIHHRIKLIIQQLEFCFSVEPKDEL
jgi:hypothetical protein